MSTFSRQRAHSQSQDCGLWSRHVAQRTLEPPATPQSIRTTSPPFGSTTGRRPSPQSSSTTARQESSRSGRIAPALSTRTDSRATIRTSSAYAAFVANAANTLDTVRVHGAGSAADEGLMRKSSPAEQLKPARKAHAWGDREDSHGLPQEAMPQLIQAVSPTEPSTRSSWQQRASEDDPVRCQFASRCVWCAGMISGRRSHASYSSDGPDAAGV